MTGEVKELVDKIREARKVAEPFEREFVAKFTAFTAVIRELMREKKWYPQDGKYSAVSHMNFASVNVFDFMEDSFFVDVMNYNGGTVEYEFFYSELDAPYEVVHVACARDIAERDACEEAEKVRKRAELLAELERLDASD